jgi:hypothetical protein
MTFLQHERHRGGAGVEHSSAAKNRDPVRPCSPGHRHVAWVVGGVGRRDPIAFGPAAAERRGRVEIEREEEPRRRLEFLWRLQYRGPRKNI